MLVLSLYPTTAWQPRALAWDLISCRISSHQASRVSGSSEKTHGASISKTRNITTDWIIHETLLSTRHTKPDCQKANMPTWYLTHISLVWSQFIYSEHQKINRRLVFSGQLWSTTVFKAGQNECSSFCRKRWQWQWSWWRRTQLRRLPVIACTGSSVHDISRLGTARSITICGHAARAQLMPYFFFFFFLRWLYIHTWEVLFMQRLSVIMTFGSYEWNDSSQSLANRMSGCVWCIFIKNKCSWGLRHKFRF